MEPDLGLLLEKLTIANEAMSQAYIRQSLAMNNLTNAIREMRENHPTLFDQKEDI